MNEKKYFLALFLVTLNVFYLLILTMGSGGVFNENSYILFLLLISLSYVAQSFGVIKFGKFSLASDFFFIFPILIIFGPLVASISAYSIAILQYDKSIKLSTRFYIGIQSAIAYYVAGLAIERFGFSWYTLIVALLLFKVINFILVDLFLYFYMGRWKDLLISFKYMALETAFLSVVLPAASIIHENLAKMPLVLFVIYTLAFPFLFIYLLSLEVKVRTELENEKAVLSRNVNQLKRVLEVSELLKSNVSIVELMMHVASIIHNDLGWEYVLISFVKPDDTIERIAYAGISGEEFKRLKANSPTISFVKNIMKNEFKISNSYFIPAEANINIPDEMTFVGKYNSIDKDSWKDRDLLWIPIYEKNGKMIAYISPDKPASGKRPTVEDVTILEIFANQVLVAIENSSEFEELQQKAIRDSQTGLYNHTEFYNKIDKMISNGEPFSILMMDIDDFKLVNDSYGHQTGDLVIEYLAEQIKLSIRHGDIAARYGGDEFVVILKGAKKQVAKSIAERLRISVLSGNQPVKITISIGIAEYPEDSKSSNGIVSSADKALYLAKMRGKNQVVLLSN
jgi:diguanylate cyclase (GGDEF)-like protein